MTYCRNLTCLGNTYKFNQMIGYVSAVVKKFLWLIIF